MGLSELQITKKYEPDVLIDSGCIISLFQDECRLKNIRDLDRRLVIEKIRVKRSLTRKVKYLYLVLYSVILQW